MKLIVAIAMILSAPMVFAQQTVQQKAQSSEDSQGFARIWAYKNFGPAFYVPSMNYPVMAPSFSYQPLNQHAIPLKDIKKANAGSDQSNWTPIPFKGKGVYYRAEYHIKDIADMDVNQMLDDSIEMYKTQLKNGPWNVTKAERAEMVNLAKIQMVVFPMDQFQIKYYPGWFLLMHEGGSMTKGALGAARGGVRWKADYFRVAQSDMPNLAGILKGAFDNIDTFRGGRPAGSIVDGVTVDVPTDYVQTVAVYDDGTLLIGPYGSLPNKARIKWLRQNELPILLNGEVNAGGAYPAGWNRYADHILRTYLFMSRDGKHVGYAWVNYAHPSFVAKVLQKIGFTDVMHLDIHPAVASGLATPSNDPNPIPFFQKGGSYPFIPIEADVLSWAARVAGEAAKGNPIQWNYLQAVTTGSSSDFFGVFLKQ